MPLAKKTYFLPLLFLSLTGCETLEDRIYGDTVPVDRSDPTPPSVQLIIPDDYLYQSLTGNRPTLVTTDVIVTDTPEYARAGKLSFPTIERETHRLAYTVVATDPEGVRAVIANDIEVTPWCWRESRTPPQPWPAEPFTIEGNRFERDASAPTATTRLPLRHEFSLQLGEENPACPAERPTMIGAIVRLTGAATNFGSDRAVETASIHIEFSVAGTGASSGYADGIIRTYCIYDPADPEPYVCPPDD